jgi:predicted O-linked N-acetylglucosamine transferase (SPINDLY family)
MQHKKLNEPTAKQSQMIQDAVALHQTGQWDAAEAQYRKLLKLLPNNTTLLNNLGMMALQKGQLDDGVKIFRRSLQINFNQPYVLNNMGNVLNELNRMDDALASYDRAIALNPDYADAYSNRGLTLQGLNRLDDALVSYDRAIVLKPDYVDAYSNRGLTLKALKRLDEALDSYEYAIALKPDFSEAYYNRGNALQELKRHDEALTSYDDAVALKPDYAEAYSNRGDVLKDLNRLDAALESYEFARALKPDMGFILGSLLYIKMQLCLWDNLPQALNELTHKINQGEKVVVPFVVLALLDDPELQNKTAKIYVNEKYPVSHVLPKIEIYPQHTKIRIGYFSADFRNHPMTHLTAELYETHDRNHFEIYAFSLGPDTQDDMNLRIKAGVDHFYDVRTLSDKEVVLLSRTLEIDIAVDLGGFTLGSRTGIFAMQTAPIQVNYLGYPGTMAAVYIDYLIADHTLIPNEQQQYYSEKIVYIPNSYMVNLSKIEVAEPTLIRQELGLPDTGFVFCCFNNSFKITPTTFASWMRILNAVEGSVLWLYEGNNSTIKNLKNEALKLGINEERLIFAKYMPIEEHLNRIQLADLFIDTLPYNAHTTASDALRMGLPVLTCIGQSFASRVAASLLKAVNMPELIATTQEQYEALAIELATHPEKLKTIKAKLVANLATAPLYDTALFTKHLESAYLTMYERYQNGLAPEHIVVEH